MNDATKTFLERYHSAAMVTLRSDGTPHVARVGMALVDGRVWSSGTQTRVRTRHLRRDPRSTLYVYDNEWRWLGLECRVNILDGADAPQLNLRLMQVMQQGMPSEPGHINWFGRTLNHEEFLKTMVEEQRVIYEFDIVRVYGMYGGL